MLLTYVVNAYHTVLHWASFSAAVIWTPR